MEHDRNNILKGYNLLLYFAGSMIMSEPTDECIVDFWTNGTLKKLPVSSLNPRFLKAASLLRDSCLDKEKCRQMLANDYFSLFDERALPLAPARASVYLGGRDNGVPVDMEVYEFYNSYGWHPIKPGKPADHLGIELLFLTQLIEKYLLLDDDPCCCEMKKEICRFINKYILSWIPSWDENVQKYAHTQSFKGISTLIYACTEDLYGIFSNGEVRLNN
ncbi:MAG TPA: molecular chaperone TorD family protein [Bacteroidales bacterium]|nr:molecular chaperone TorD family protein [Bacteroidales bacterium]